MNNRLGFTMVELVIALIVIGILSLISVPAYRGYVKKGLTTEGKALLNEIDSAQQIYYARHGKYYSGTANQQHGASFGVDTRKNKYFTAYTITVSGNSYRAVAVTKDSGKNMTILGSLSGEPKIVDNFTSKID